MACSHVIGGEKPIALARDTVQGTARTGGKDLLFKERIVKSHLAH